jgi:endoglucanase
MHQYFNQNLDGRSPECTSNTVGIDYLAKATNWCQTNNKMCFLGEFAAGYDPVCLNAMDDMLSYMTFSQTWIGALWWWAGPWTTNPSDTRYLSIEEGSPTREIYFSGLLRNHKRSALFREKDAEASPDLEL